MKVEEFILSYSIILIAIMVVGHVLSRALFGPGWAFHSEISQYTVVLATFMGISYAARKGRHINMSAFFDVAPYPIRKALAIFIPAVTAIVLFILTVFSVQYVVNVYESGRVTTNLQWPEYLLIIPVPVGLFLGGLQFLRNMWINLVEKDVYLATENKDYDSETQISNI